MNSKIIAVDFDGTLCENKWPEIGEARRDVISYVLKSQKNGAKLILWTNRVDERLDEAVKWCKEHGIIFDAVNDNLQETVDVFGSNCRKIFANEYIDDRNSSFSTNGGINEHMSQSDRMELWGELIDVVEDWLENKGISKDDISNDEREGDEAAIIYGCDYDYFADRFSDIIGISRDNMEELDEQM